MKPATERRRHPRLAVTHPVKVQCRMTGRYYVAATCDLSASGALLAVDHPSRLVVGQRVRIAVVPDRRQALIQSEDLAEAVVVRSHAAGRGQHVAVQFDRIQQIEHTAAPRQAA